MPDDTKPKYINTISDLPDWFNIDNYSFTDNLSYQRWGQLLQVRSHTLETIRRYGMSWPADEFINLISSNPDITEWDLPLDEDFRLDIEKVKEIKSKLKNESYGLGDEHSFISPLTYKDIKEFYTSIRSTKDSRFNGLEYSISDINLLFRHPEHPELLRSGNGVYLNISLDAPDAVLMREFSTLLKLYRKKLGFDQFSKEPTQATLRKLHDYRILPYLDLLIWSEREGIKIQSRILAIALFPYGEKGEYQINHNIKQLAETAIDDQFLLALNY